MNDATVKFGFDGADVMAGIDRLEKRMVSMEKSSVSAFSRLRGAVAGIGLGMLAKDGAEAVMSMDRLRRGIMTLEGSAENADARLREMQDLAELPGVGFQQAVQADIKLRSVGLSAQMSADAIREFGNALAASGGSSADLDGVILALTQIVSQGKVSAEEINQIAGRVPQIRAVMKDVFGTANTEELQKMNLTAEDFVSGLIMGFGGLTRAAAGLDEKMEDFRTSVMLAEEAFMDGLVRNGIEGAQSFGDALQENNDLFHDLGVAVKDVFVGGLNMFRTTGHGIGWAGQILYDLKESGSVMEALQNTAGLMAEQERQKIQSQEADREAADARRKKRDEDSAKRREQIAKRLQDRSEQSNQSKTDKDWERESDMRLKLMEAERDLMLDELDIKGQILEAEKQISDAKDAAEIGLVFNDMNRVLEADLKRVAAQKELNKLRKEQARDNQREAQAAQDRAERLKNEKAARDEAATSIMAELELLRMRAGVRGRAADKLERELRIQRDIKRFMEEAEATQEQAEKWAREKARHEDAIEAKRQGKRRKIFGTGNRIGFDDESGLDHLKKMQMKRELDVGEKPPPGYGKGDMVPVYPAFPGRGKPTGETPIGSRTTGYPTGKRESIPEMAARLAQGGPKQQMVAVIGMDRLVDITARGLLGAAA